MLYLRFVVARYSPENSASWRKGKLQLPVRGADRSADWTGRVPFFGRRSSIAPGPLRLGIARTGGAVLRGRHCLASWDWTFLLLLWPSISTLCRILNEGARVEDIAELKTMPGINIAELKWLEEKVGEKIVPSRRYCCMADTVLLCGRYRWVEDTY